MLDHKGVGLSTYVAKIERRTPLPQEQREALLALSASVANLAPQQDVLTTGDRATHCVIVEEGLLSRLKILKSGARQILAFCLPGDAADLQSLLFSRIDHRIFAHTQARVLFVPHAEILALIDRYPAVARALWMDTLVDAAIFREWTANVGHRNARERIAHLILEFAARFEAIGELRGDSFELPLSQRDLADALGLSLVHLNKSLQGLRRQGVVAIKGRSFRIVDRRALEELSGFDRTYLHLDQVEGAAKSKFLDPD